MNHLIPLFIFLFFFLDVTLFGFFNCQFFHLITSLFCATLFFPQKSLIVLSAIIMPLLLEEFLIDGRFGIQLLYIVPITFLILYLRPYFREDSFILPFLSLLFFILIKSLFRSGFIMPNTYIFFEICVNIVVLFIFLKYIVKGRLDNRLYA